MRDARSAPAARSPLEVSRASDRSIARLVSWMSRSALSGEVQWQRRPLPGVGEVRDGEPRVLCVSPQDWLVVFPTANPGSTADLGAVELSRQGLACIEVTAGLCVLELKGTGASRILGKSCSLDFEGGGLEAGRCARVRFASIPVVIHCLRSGELFELYLARSHGAYLQSWLADAANGIAT